LGGSHTYKTKQTTFLHSFIDRCGKETRTEALLIYFLEMEPKALHKINLEPPNTGCKVEIVYKFVKLLYTMRIMC
jgi:hypothetical protein